MIRWLKDEGFEKILKWINENLQYNPLKNNTCSCNAQNDFAKVCTYVWMNFTAEDKKEEESLFIYTKFGESSLRKRKGLVAIGNVFSNIVL